jgi:hypothetical protein
MQMPFTRPVLGFEREKERERRLILGNISLGWACCWIRMPRRLPAFDAGAKDLRKPTPSSTWKARKNEEATHRGAT